MKIMEKLDKNMSKLPVPSTPPSSNKNRSLTSGERNNELRCSTEMAYTPLKTNRNAHMTFPQVPSGGHNKHQESVIPFALSNPNWK